MFHLKTLFATVFTVFAINSYATNYYVSNSGSNHASGTSPTTPWETISHVNLQSFQPGDSVLFDRGGVWRTAEDEALEFTSSGNSNNYITYGAYGTGAKPKFIGSNQIENWTNVSGNIWQAQLDYNPRDISYGAELFFETSDSTLWGLHLEYDASFTNLDTDLDWTWNNNTAYLFSVSNPNDRFISSEAPQTQRLVYLNNHEYVALDNLELAYAVAMGIYDSYNPTHINGLRVTNCHIHHIGHKDSGQAFGLSVRHSDMYIAHNEISDCGRRGISLVTYDNEPVMNLTNIMIEHNYFHDGWHTTGVDMNTQGAHTLDSVIIRNNYFHDPIHNDISENPPGKSLTSNHIFISQQGTGDIGNVYVYNNIFNGHHGNGVLMAHVHDIHVYHNTFYGYNHSHTNYSGFVTFEDAENIFVKNNIFSGNGDPANFRDSYLLSVNDTSSYTSSEVDYNLYFEEHTDSRFFMFQNEGRVGTQRYFYYNTDQWPDYQQALRYDKNSPVPSAPIFIDPEAANFRIDEGSTAIDAALPLPIVTFDYYGRTRSANAPTLGAIEYGNYVTSFTDDKILASELTLFHLYPNPSNGIIQLEDVKGLSVEIIDVYGRTVFRKNSGSQTLTIEHALPTGVYVVHVSDANKTVGLQKLVVYE